MLTEKQVGRACVLFEKSFLHRRRTIEGLPELRALLRRATPEQRRLITREEDPSVQMRVLTAAIGAFGMIFEITDPIVSHIDGIWVPPDRFPGSGSADASLAERVSTEAGHDVACAPRRKRRSRRHAPLRSWDGQRPWAYRLRVPRHRN